MSCSTKGLSSTQTAKRYGIIPKTSWMFMQKVKLAMKSSANHPIKGNGQVDEFVVGGKETGKQGRSFDSKKSKVACAIELTEDGKIKRGYANVINDYSAKSIKPLFDIHIDKEAKIKTDIGQLIKSSQKIIILFNKKVFLERILKKCAQ